MCRVTGYDRDLALSRAEHIEEVTYHDCTDMSVERPHADMAMFIVLKPGIGYDVSRGSYVIGTTTAGNAAETDPLVVLVDEKTSQNNRLRDCLKLYFPQLLRWFNDVAGPLVGALLERWPNLPALQRSHPGTLRKFFNEQIVDSPG